jgi:23S rRNA pseudouridine1911/1915/1917 synthase
VLYNFKFDSDNQRLDEFLRRELPGVVVECSRSECIETTKDLKSFSNSKIRRLILAGAVQVNGREVRRPAFELRGHSTVTVNFDTERFFFEKQPDDVAFEMSDTAVLYEDDNLIFVDKPADFPVEQTITGNRANLHDAVVDYLWKRQPELRNPPYVGIMHRLDRTTSGVILFTKTRAVNKEISEVFQSHNLTKQYLAVVEAPRGADSRHPEQHCHSELVSGSQFTVEMFMGRLTGKSQQGKWGQLSEARGGQYSKTDFRVLRHITVEGRPCLLIECTLYTGRTHQIRVHLASRGLPILGDELYGGSSASRMYLHAARLAFSLEGKTYDVTSSFNKFL